MGLNFLHVEYKIAFCICIFGIQISFHFLKWINLRIKDQWYPMPVLNSKKLIPLNQAEIIILCYKIFII